MHIFDNYSHEYKTRKSFELWIESCYERAAIINNVSVSDTEEIDDGISTEMKKVMPYLLILSEKRNFHEKYLCVMTTLKKWIANMHYSEMMLEQTTCILEQLCKGKNLKGHSEEFDWCLLPDHELVTSPNFERGVVKILSRQSEALTVLEQIECSCLLKSKWPHLYPPGEDTVNLEMVDYPGKFRKMMESGKKHMSHDTKLDSKYIDCSFLSLTTVVVETLFSHCSHVLTADCQCVEPQLFEAIIFLHENNEWWDVELVQSMIVGL